MKVYGIDEQLIDYRSFPKHLVPGTTVLVTFSLKHYAIRERGTPKIISDTFNACLDSVSILKEAEKKIRPTPSSTPKRRPLPVSQLPSRASQKLASDTFSPIRVRTEPSFASAYRAAHRHQDSPVAGPSSPSKKKVQIDALPLDKLPTSATPAPAVTSDFAEELVHRMMPFIMERLGRRADSSLKRTARTPSPNRSASPTISAGSESSVVGADAPVDVSGTAEEANRAESSTENNTSTTDGLTLTTPSSAYVPVVPEEIPTEIPAEGITEGSELNDEDRGPDDDSTYIVVAEEQDSGTCDANDMGECLDTDILLPVLRPQTTFLSFSLFII